MSILQKIENGYKNQIKIIKNEKDYKKKMELIGALVLDLGERCINAVAKTCNCSWRYVKKCYLIVKNNLSEYSEKRRTTKWDITATPLS